VGVDLTPKTRLQVMGGWVQWSVFKDYDITISGAETYNDLKKPETAEVVNQHRLWARENQDSGWIAGDIKGDVKDFTVGGRILYDRAAVPDEALSPNNYDANEVVFSGLAAWRPIPALTLGLSGSYHLVSTRQVSTSAFGVTLDPATRKEDRWFYPDSNGIYSGSILRLGVQAKAEF
jgi:long-subunit fatty acid transport protein